MKHRLTVMIDVDQLASTQEHTALEDATHHVLDLLEHETATEGSGTRKIVYYYNSTNDWSTNPCPYEWTFEELDGEEF